MWPGLLQSRRLSGGEHPRNQPQIEAAQVSARSANLQDARLLPPLEDIERLRLIVRRDDDVIQHTAHRGCGLGGKCAVIGDDAPVRRHGIALQRPAVCRRLVVVYGESARIEVLDDTRCRLRKVGHGRPRCLGVEVVGEGHLDAVQPFCVHDPPCRQRVTVNRPLLMRILAVAQVGDLLEPDSEFRAGQKVAVAQVS